MRTPPFAIRTPPSAQEVVLSSLNATSRLSFSGPLPLILMTLAVFVSTQLASAQQTLGSVNGTVTDASGAVVQGAKIKAHAVATNLEVTAQSKGDGSFSITDLPIGT